MALGTLSWRRLGVLTLGVMALHALLLRGVHDTLAARAPDAPRPSVATLRVRTLVQASAGRAATATVGLAPAAVQAPPVPPVDLVPPAVSRRAATRREAAPRTAKPDDTPPSAAAAPARAPRAEPVTPAPVAAAPPGVTAVAGAAAAAVPGDQPIYRTRLPPAFAFGYELRRGAASGSGELHWQPQGDHYRARLAGSIGGSPLLEWDSSGGFDEAGIAPARYTDRRRDRGTQAANFRRDLGKVTFSGPAVEHALAARAQDRLS